MTTVYFAAGLFNFGQIIANLWFKNTIEARSDGRYSIILPQNLPQKGPNIKLNDLRTVQQADASIFLFDGAFIDEGVIVEFMANRVNAKPAIVLRTDFRQAGDYNPEPWNLMLSKFPRTSYIVVDDLMSKYKTSLKEHQSLEDVIYGVINPIIDKLLHELDYQLQRPVTHNISQNMFEEIFCTQDAEIVDAVTMGECN